MSLADFRIPRIGVSHDSRCRERSFLATIAGRAVARLTRPSASLASEHTTDAVLCVPRLVARRG
eukprot:1194927-Prorocentrum_minimum.AAC.1